MTEDRPTTRSQRLRGRMEKDAERQAIRRKAMREQGRPATHAVDRAIAEAVAYVALRNLRDGEKMDKVLLSFLTLLGSPAASLRIGTSSTKPNRPKP